MDSSLVMKILFEVTGGLGIFLLGMKNMSEGMQAVAGEKLRSLIGAVTNNRILACFVGTLVTSIIQSSSVTTVMVVGMVNASLMNLMQAIGVILGANIGTTITGWILVLKIGKYGLPMLGLAAFFFLFSKKDVIRFTASFFLGLGMVFFGLELMKNGFKPLKDLPQFVEMFSKFSPSSYLDYVNIIKCVAIGACLTAIVQSSSATLGITVGLATTGAISYPAAAALVLGENIGTTITAFLASLGASTNAKRASYAHMLINVIGVIWIVSIFWLYVPAVEKFVGLDGVEAERAAEFGEPEKFGFMIWDEPDAEDMSTEEYETAKAEYDHADEVLRAAIATTHTGFNVVNMLVFLPFVGLLAKLLQKLAPDKEYVERPHLTFLDVRMLDTPAISIEQSHKEIIKMSEIATDMLNMLREHLPEGAANREKSQELFKQEKIMDVMQKEIVEFLTNLLSGNIAHKVILVGRKQLRMADEYESISDYLMTLMKLRLKMLETDQHLSKEGEAEILELHDKVTEYVAVINTAVKNQNVDVLVKAQTLGSNITKLMKQCRAEHLERVGAGVIDPLKSLIFTDMLTAYRRIKDHTFNIAEVLTGEK